MSKRPTLWMLIGVPCSGKSTWCADQFVDHKMLYYILNEDENQECFIASTDSIIQDVADTSDATYDEMFKDTIKSAERLMYKYVAQATARNLDIIWDQTNLTRKSRAKKLIMIPDHYEKIAVVFSTPEPDELHLRLQSRPGKTIPYHIVKSMIESMEYPEKDEGFDYILTRAEDHVYV